MGLRFRKSIKICKGVKVNISKSGLSLSVGTKGASLNFSEKGTRVSAGLPGTGLSYSKMIGKKSSSSSHKSIFDSLLEKEIIYSLDMDEKGRIIILDEDNNEISDVDTIKKIKSTSAYKKKESQLKQEREIELQQYVQQASLESQELIDIYKHAAYVRSKQDYLEQLQGNYKGNSIEENTIDLQDQTSLLDDFYRTISDKREKYTHQEVLETNEDPQEISEGDQELMKLIEGDEKAICDSFDKWIASIELPVEVNINYSWDASTNTMHIDTDLPEIEDIPNMLVERSINGTVKEKKKTQETIRKEYNQVIFGLAIVIVSHVFDLSPMVEKVVISAYTQRRNKLGDLVDTYVYSLKFERSQFEHIRVDLKDPLEFCLNTTNRINMTTSYLLKEITPY